MFTKTAKGCLCLFFCRLAEFDVLKKVFFGWGTGLKRTKMFGNVVSEEIKAKLHFNSCMKKRFWPSFLCFLGKKRNLLRFSADGLAHQLFHSRGKTPPNLS